MFFSDVAEKSVEKIQARWISKRHSYVFYTSPAWVEVGFFCKQRREPVKFYYRLANRQDMLIDCKLLSQDFIVSQFLDRRKRKLIGSEQCAQTYTSINHSPEPCTQ